MASRRTIAIAPKPATRFVRYMFAYVKIFYLFGLFFQLTLFAFCLVAASANCDDMPKGRELLMRSVRRNRSDSERGSTSVPEERIRNIDRHLLGGKGSL